MSRASALGDVTYPQSDSSASKRSHRGSTRAGRPGPSANRSPSIPAGRAGEGPIPREQCRAWWRSWKACRCSPSDSEGTGGAGHQAHSTVSRIMCELAAGGMLDRFNYGTYVLGARVFDLAAAIKPAGLTVTNRVLEALRALTGETVCLCAPPRHSAWSSPRRQAATPTSGHPDQGVENLVWTVPGDILRAQARTSRCPVSRFRSRSRTALRRPRRSWVRVPDSASRPLSRRPPRCRPRRSASLPGPTPMDSPAAIPTLGLRLGESADLKIGAGAVSPVRTGHRTVAPQSTAGRRG